MRIAVTGGTGFIGRHVLQLLEQKGHDDILVVGRTPPGGSFRSKFVPCDLLTEEAHGWISTYRPSHLLHLAWYAEHGKFWDSPLNREWRDATTRLSRAFCERGGKHIVVTGSCAEYDWSGEDYCIEDVTHLNPGTLYGQEKRRTWKSVQEICQLHGTSLVWGRIFFPFGPGESDQRLIPSVVNALLGKQPNFAINTGDIRDLVPAHIVADALVYLLNSQIDGAFNICSGVPTRLERLIKTLGEALDRDSRPLLELGSERGSGPRFLVGDNQALLRTGWRPRFELENSLKDYARFLERVDIQY